MPLYNDVFIILICHVRSRPICGWASGLWRRSRVKLRHVNGRRIVIEVATISTGNGHWLWSRARAPMHWLKSTFCGLPSLVQPINETGWYCQREYEPRERNCCELPGQEEHNIDYHKHHAEHGPQSSIALDKDHMVYNHGNRQCEARIDPKVNTLLLRPPHQVSHSAYHHGNPRP